MKKILKHLNVIYYIFLFLAGVMLLSALPFKTQYNTVSINLEKGATIADATAGMTNARGMDQSALWNYYGGNPAAADLQTVYDFQTKINTVNNLILVFGLVMLLGICFLCILNNHKRKIYYGSNVAFGFIVNLGIIVFAAIILIQIFGLIGMVGSNNDLFNVVALLQHPTKSAIVSQDIANIKSYYFVNPISLLVYMIGFIVCIVYSFFVLILTFAKFSRTKERRKEIIAKAVENND